MTGQPGRGPVTGIVFRCAALFAAGFLAAWLVKDVDGAAVGAAPSYNGWLGTSVILLVVLVFAGAAVVSMVRAFSRLGSVLGAQITSLEENAARLSGVLQQMASGVLVVDDAGRVVLVNRAFEQLNGVSRERVIGRSYKEAVRSMELARLVEHVFRRQEPARDELRWTFSRECILDVHAVPFRRGTTGDLVGVVVVLHDITEIRRLEQVRREFVANVSHELKTPVTSLKGFAETLLDGAMYDEKTCRAFLEIIYEESERLSRLIQDLLQLSQIENRQIVLRKGLLSARDEMADVLRLIAHTAEAKRQTVENRVPEGVRVYADRDRLRQILLNLLNNAIAYTPPGGRITLTGGENEESTWLTVRDTGPGIP
ncbi:MAG: cell wall metabolism sensor histidine kinase WalK, partial [Calditerricola sp.]|nr:cell wall metabolism sensor histidine kinase WalK [Calditerricola sp.]